ncbi:MAG: S4 domain-containing protein [Candidatus Micrarchaeaceae archaeon]|jgi:small subunit ribosomal protein S4e
MGNKGSSGYIKRLNAPKYFSVHRKEHKYIIKQNPGRHTLQKSIALTVVLEKLDLTANRREADKIIKNGLVKVNSKTIKNQRYPIGLNDFIEIGKEKYVVNINERGQILIKKIEKEEHQVYKIVGKYKYRKNVIMLRLHDGSIIKEGEKSDANVNDSIAIANKKVSKIIKLSAGSKCEIIDGVHVGKTGKIKSISEGNIHKVKSVVVEQSNGNSFETLVKNIIVVE